MRGRGLMTCPFADVLGEAAEKALDCSPGSRESVGGEGCEMPVCGRAGQSAVTSTGVSVDCKLSMNARVVQVRCIWLPKTELD